jgi:hypothetical protein
MIPISRLVFHPDNPNRMTDKQFAQLMDVISEDGFDEPIQVVPLGEVQGDGLCAQYRVIGGEHRVKAGRGLGMAEVPCVVKKAWTDEQTQAEKMVQRNLLKGNLDSAKFSVLVNKLVRDDGVPLDELPDRMGFISTDEFAHYYTNRASDQAEAQAQAEKDRAAAAGGDDAGTGAGEDTSPPDTGKGAEGGGEKTSEGGSQERYDSGKDALTYTITFTSQDEQETWYSFLRHVNQSGDWMGEPVGTRVVAWLRNHGGVPQ